MQHLGACALNSTTRQMRTATARIPSPPAVTQRTMMKVAPNHDRLARETLNWAIHSSSKLHAVVVCLSSGLVPRLGGRFLRLSL